MSSEPALKNAMAFFDAQNHYQHAKAAFGHHHPNFDPLKLHRAVCAANGWRPTLVRFYTGVPTEERSPMWHGYWSRRLLGLKRAGVVVTTRPLRYRPLARRPGCLYCPREGHRHSSRIGSCVTRSQTAIRRRRDIQSRSGSRGSCL